MASILIIEDGTGVANANSYATAAQARAYATLRGVTLPDAPADGQDPVETMLVLAADYLNAKSFVGFQVIPQQSLAWPRVLTAPYRGYPFYPCYDYFQFLELNVSSNYYVLPDTILKAQCQLCVEQQNGISLLPSTPGGIDGQFITRTKVDVIETNYSEKIGTLTQPTMPAVDSILVGLVVRGGGQSALTVVRA